MKTAEEWASPVHGAWDLHGVAHLVRQIQADALLEAANVIDEHILKSIPSDILRNRAKGLKS